jgi:hypothetical protein
MANNSKRTSQLGIAPTLQSNDRIVVLTNPANTTIANTQTIVLSNFWNAIANNLPGPYANDSVANTNGIAVKNLYFDVNGFIRIRMS